LNLAIYFSKKCPQAKKTEHTKCCMLEKMKAQDKAKVKAFHFKKNSAQDFFLKQS